MIALTPLRLAIVALWCAMTGLGAEPPATFSAQLSLVRYDLPRGRSDGYAPTRQKAVKQEGPVGVDWPDFTFNGMPVFRGRAEEVVTVKLRRGNEASSPFRVDADDAIEPGGHWFRGMEWLQGKYHLYTADKTARCGASAAEAVGKYELWTFPIRIEGQGAPIVKNVVLKSEGVVVYNKPGPWRSLTLLLPASALGESYELTIDGRGPVKFQAGGCYIINQF